MLDKEDEVNEVVAGWGRRHIHPSKGTIFKPYKSLTS